MVNVHVRNQFTGGTYHIEGLRSLSLRGYTQKMWLYSYNSPSLGTGNPLICMPSAIRNW